MKTWRFRDGNGPPYGDRTEASILPPPLLLHFLLDSLGLQVELSYSSLWLPGTATLELAVGGWDSAGSARQRCCAVVGFACLSVQTAVGVYFVINYSAHNKRAAAWKHMSSCLGVIDTKAGKYLLDHPILV